MIIEKENKTRTLHTRFKTSTWDKLAELAALDHRSISSWLEVLVEAEYAKKKQRTP